MAVNFNLLAREGPTNLYEGFAAGQQAAAQNALAQQKMAQERELGALRHQEFQAKLESAQAERKRKAVADKTAMFRERLLRASTPQAARELVKLQHSDPDLGPVMQQFGSLDQDLADIPDDPTGFENWRQREAMGAAELIKSQASERSFQELLAKARGGQPRAAAPAPEGELVAPPIRPIPSPVAAPTAANAPAPVGETDMAYLQRQFGTPSGAAPNALAPAAAAPATNVLAAPTGGGRPTAQIRAEIDTLSMSNDPRAVRMVQTLQKEYQAALQGDQNKPMAVSRGQVVIDPRTGRQIFAAPETVTLSDRFVPVGRLVFDRQTQQYISPTQAQLTQSQERAPSAAAPSGKPPAGYRFTPSGDLEPIPGGPASPGLAPKDIQKREAAFPQATQSVKGFVTKSNQFIAELERLRDDPGLDQITGPIYGRTPSVSRAGSRAQALYDKIFAKGGFQALQDMREASKTGGALGNVSNEEGRRLEKSVVGGLDRTQNIADVQQGINDLIDEIRTSQARVQEAYDTTYEYRAQRGGGAANVDQERANARAAIAAGAPEAAVRKRFKEKTGQEF